ncbi:hypothetical protein EX30DRAFT_228650 [Ascodesmis nigricans]|uniref:Zn(2)-C6 fungal-type domain-containing protein n=1 Tax=Ascodesmis nigricans TaxID=341454 RepID=A0A4S2MIL9_9PEZI|nr:hypothetical protein EX30DRAFT_228650 [Ascodesmis nigricans]
MIASTTAVAIPPPPAMAATPTSPTQKKRRRRAPTTGAAEDCFSCRAAGTKCDRKRPYCGPCLDLGVICKGYRTQLTWGVGVASRGKLRGMTLPITNAQLEERKAKDKAAKKNSEGKGTNKTENTIEKRLRAASHGTPGYGGIQRASPPSNVKKLSIVTNYDFVNMEPPSSVSAAPRSASVSSQPSTQSAVSAPSPALARPPPLPSSCPPPEQHSPQSALSSPYSASQPRYHSPVMPPAPSPVHHYSTSPVPTFKPSFGHVTMPPHQAHAQPSMILSPMSEYEPSYPSPQHQHQHYPISSAPSSAPVYDIVSGVSSASYHSPSMTVTTSGMPYSPMPAMHSNLPRMMSNEHLNQQHSRPQWTPANAGIAHLHHHHHHHEQMANGQGRITELLYDEDVLASPNSEHSSSYSPSASVLRFEPHPATRNEAIRRLSNPAPPHPSRSHSYPPPRTHPRSMSMDSSLKAPHLVDISVSQRYLIQYYDQTVCRALVAIDGPSNPYRTQILPMAFSNQALLEAVYSLSQSHLNSGKRLGQLPEESLNGQQAPPLSPGSRALRYKANATHLLQTQLSDPEQAKHDAVSATLLILLWHHICETGIAHFKIHLAGVKRLMMLRQVGKETGRWGWMETVFTWMDNMAATLNNREPQLRGTYLDMIYESTDEWGLENLVGCDRGLFMRLAGLGRLNILSQMLVDPYAETQGPTHGHPNDPHNPPRNENDGRSDFWMPWNAMKQDLSTYTPSLPSSFAGNSASSSSTPSPRSPGLPTTHETNRTHSTNVYRHAALLYLDRLAYPHLPSSHPVFQSTLKTLLHHVSSISSTSEISQKLLWPIFVAGSECVEDQHRDIVRARIAGMMSMGLGNRGSALGMLERVWMDYDMEGANASGFPSREAGMGLRWRCSDGEEAEYLLI